MNIKQLQLLLNQDEDPTLEFKREWYKLQTNDEARDRLKGELIKDVLALANGSVASAGKDAYLIIGVDDKRNAEGSRELYDIGESIPASTTIIDIVKSASEPPLSYIEVVRFTVSGKRIFAIVIPPSPHLHETTRKISTSSQTYSEHIVFIRHNDSVAIASAKEREALQKAKQRHFAETRKVPPVRFGAMIGAIIGAFIFMQIGQQQYSAQGGGIVGTIIGAIFGGLMGGMLGSIYKDANEIKSSWRVASKQKRVVGTLIAIAMLIVVIGFLLLTKR